jgi:endonuclease/exonuclease/phosphatase family metal-dependent hydrolase
LPATATDGYAPIAASAGTPPSSRSSTLDHLIVSSEVEVPVCGYLHQWRDEGLSDHSALVAHIRWPNEKRC